MRSLSSAMLKSHLSSSPPRGSSSNTLLIPGTKLDYFLCLSRFRYLFATFAFQLRSNLLIEMEEFMVGPRLYSCWNCRNHVSLHDDIISKAFQV
ncbi:Protein yippee-like At4g27745 [Linum perenne]